MAACLGLEVNTQRVRRLLRKMGLEAIHQKPNTSKPNPEHKVYPYRLRGLVIDWYSRYVYYTSRGHACGFPKIAEILVTTQQIAGIFMEHRWNGF
jgi:hypothetical protein